MTVERSVEQTQFMHLRTLLGPTRLSRVARVAALASNETSLKLSLTSCEILFGSVIHAEPGNNLDPAPSVFEHSLDSILHDMCVGKKEQRSSFSTCMDCTLGIVTA